MDKQKIQQYGDELYQSLLNRQPVAPLTDRETDISIEDGLSKVTMEVDHEVPIPADANALLVAQSLVAERFIQLTPAHTGGPEMEDGGDRLDRRDAVSAASISLEAIVAELESRRPSGG